MPSLHFAAPLCAWLTAHGTSCIELVAFLFGAVSVYLSVRQKIWSWPTAIVNVGLYAYIFGTRGYYSDAGLQVVYLALSVYGWVHWLHGGENHGTLPVSRASRRTWAVCAVVGVALWLALGAFTSTLPNAQRPFTDAALTSTSLVAQWMMTRKLVESWILWIAVDLVYVPLWLAADLPLTALLYGIFLVLAVMGWREWRRDIARRHAAQEDLHAAA
ncbi:MAG TPA: nicotinamide riboside transporter PnuC [Gemmatimonadaceae bacterium]|nr:nicotinamide riboside transporter PnuC [Gemmatimonadaceae bacterium]